MNLDVHRNENAKNPNSDILNALPWNCQYYPKGNISRGNSFKRKYSDSSHHKPTKRFASQAIHWDSQWIAFDRDNLMYSSQNQSLLINRIGLLIQINLQQLLGCMSPMSSAMWTTKRILHISTIACEDCIFKSSVSIHLSFGHWSSTLKLKMFSIEIHILYE